MYYRYVDDLDLLLIVVNPALPFAFRVPVVPHGNTSVAPTFFCRLDSYAGIRSRSHRKYCSLPLGQLPTNVAVTA